MKHVRPLALVVAFLAAGFGAWAQPLFLDFPGKDGPGKGRRIVLIAGDEEYRTEESMPMLGKILSQRHGFDCTVLFSLDPTGKFIDPNNQKSVSRIDALDKAARKESASSPSSTRRLQASKWWHRHTPRRSPPAR